VLGPAHRPYPDDEDNEHFGVKQLERIQQTVVVQQGTYGRVGVSGLWRAVGPREHAAHKTPARVNVKGVPDLADIFHLTVDVVDIHQGYVIIEGGNFILEVSRADEFVRTPYESHGAEKITKPLEPQRLYFAVHLEGQRN